MKSTVYVSKFGDDIRLITEHLNAEGLYPTNAKVVHDLYSMYSEECYSAGWLYVDEYVLERFTLWLKEFLKKHNLYSEEL